MTSSENGFIRAARLSELEQQGQLTVQVDGHTLVLFQHQERIYAVDNRCPHMGFPLDRGSVCDGILTCHWHHARFDLASGGSFDLWADDVPTYAVEVRAGEIWVDLTPSVNALAEQRERLEVGLERDLPLLLGKSVLNLMEDRRNAIEPFRMGLGFGTRYRDGGWGQGLTMLTCFMNMTPALDAEERPRALYHGLAAVARDIGRHGRRVSPCGRCPARCRMRRRSSAGSASLSRCATPRAPSAVSCRLCGPGMAPAAVADMLFAAVTDHRYIDVGHPLDFTNKALEALDATDWDNAALVLTSLVARLCYGRPDGGVQRLAPSDRPGGDAGGGI